MSSESTPRYWPNQNPTQFVERMTDNADRRVFKYTSGEEEARARFLQLAIDSYNFLHTLPSDRPDGIHPGYSFYPKHMPAYIDKMRQHSPSLLIRWENWEREYSEMRPRNPLLDLSHMIHDMGESYDCSGWKIGAETRIRHWVDAGDSSARPPMCDQNFITPEFYKRLQQIRQIIGGWLYYVEETGDVQFMTDADWEQHCAKRAAKTGSSKN